MWDLVAYLWRLPVNPSQDSIRSPTHPTHAWSVTGSLFRGLSSCFSHIPLTAVVSYALRFLKLILEIILHILGPQYVGAMLRLS